MAMGGGCQRCLQCADNNSRLGENGKNLTFLQMSEDQLKAFLEAVKADAGLQEKLKTATSTETVAAIARGAGFVISGDDIEKAQAEISEEELEGIAGGAGQTLNCTLCLGFTCGDVPI